MATPRPSEASPEVWAVLEEMADRYNVPISFLAAIARGESSFDPRAVGSGNNLGLFQLGGEHFTGGPYPYGLQSPDDEYQQWKWDMGIEGSKEYGDWISMSEVSPLYDPFDPRQNTQRFLTGFAVPFYQLQRRLHPEESPEVTWERVADAWYRGPTSTFTGRSPGHASDAGPWGPAGDYLEKYRQNILRFEGRGGRDEQGNPVLWADPSHPSYTGGAPPPPPPNPFARNFASLGPQPVMAANPFARQFNSLGVGLGGGRQFLGPLQTQPRQFNWLDYYRKLNTNPWEQALGQLPGVWRG